jgi:hypothetical protein
MNFCDFCPCESCKTGTFAHKVSHAETSDGRHICDVCYTYDLCTSGIGRNPNGPCDNKNCSHRPTIVSEWTPASEFSSNVC